MAKYKVVVAELGYRSYEPETRALAGLDVKLVTKSCLTEEALIETCRDAHGILVRTVAPVTRNVISRLERCRIISRYGVGVDNVDIGAATEHGIMVANVPDYCVEEVSDQAVALLLACARRVASRDSAVRAGAWDVGAKEPLYRIAGKVLGLVGYGKIARAAHRKLAGFNFARTLVFDPFVDDEALRAAGAEKADLDALCAEADFISLHAPLSDATRHMIGKEQLGLMKPTAVIVNTSRGGLIDTEALVGALSSGTIRGAGLDVYEEEPPPKDHPLLSLRNVVLSDHVSWYSEESQLELQTNAAVNVAQALRREPVTNLLNPDALGSHR